MSFGVGPAGFTPKILEDISSDISTDLRGPSGIDPAIDLSPAQPLGQLLGAFAKQLAEAWEVGAVLANVLNPNAAEGVLLENACSITGTKRDGATKGTIKNAQLTLGASKTVPAGSVASVAGQPGNRWVLDADVTSTTAGAYLGNFTAEATGPQVANAGTLTTIATPVTGWSAVTNPLDATIGTVTETDTHLRQKRRLELAADGGTTLDAMRAKLLQLTGMIEAKVYENTSRAAYDAYGRPPGGVEAVIHDGVTPTVADVDIARVVWTNKAAGAALTGSTSATYTDSTGTVQTVPFTRAAVVQVAVAISVQIDSATFPADGVAQIKAAIVAKGLASIHVGASIYPLTYQASILGVVPGIANITSYLHGRIADGPVFSTPLTATVREIFHYDTSNIAVTIV